MTSGTGSRPAAGARPGGGREIPRKRTAAARWTRPSAASARRAPAAARTTVAGRPGFAARRRPARARGARTRRQSNAASPGDRRACCAPSCRARPLRRARRRRHRQRCPAALRRRRRRWPGSSRSSMCRRCWAPTGHRCSAGEIAAWGPLVFVCVQFGTTPDDRHRAARCSSSLGAGGSGGVAPPTNSVGWRTLKRPS